MTNIDLTPILQAVIGLIAALIAYRLIPWIKARTTTEQQAQYMAAVRVAVFAAEQIFGAGKGAEKMDYAINYLREKGFDVDSREIEATVGEFINELDLKIVSTQPPDVTEDDLK
ncbi:MAG: holin [Clostridiales bacterium]|nr:holin [Clostridiales bacterium]